MVVRKDSMDILRFRVLSGEVDIRVWLGIDLRPYLVAETMTQDNP